MADFVKTPCKHCPFRMDVKPFLHPQRAEEIAYVAENKYSSFPCHKTIKYDGVGGCDMSKQKECAGMLTLRAHIGGKVPDGFMPAWDECYEDINQMIEAYEANYYPGT